VTLSDARAGSIGIEDPMDRAVELAQSVRGRVSPNPPVGAVLVRAGRIVGEGSTQPPGGPHAEVVALREAGEAARGATLYVTLEPCSHHGRTPPCTDAILAAGVSRVVYAQVDPDSQVDGRGIRRLESAGVTVETGKHQRRVSELLADYVKHRRTGLPFVTAKFAMSLDGKIGTRTGDSRWVSGPQTLAWVHEERTRLDALAVGVNTVLVDDPQLTARPGGQHSPVHQPLRVVLDSRGRTPASAHVLGGDSHTLLVTTATADDGWKERIRSAGAEVETLPDENGRVDLESLLTLLGGRGCINLLVEGGGILLGSFFDAGLVDRVQAVVAPLIIGGAEAPLAVAGRGVERMADALRLQNVTIRALGADTMIQGFLQH